MRCIPDESVDPLDLLEYGEFVLDLDMALTKLRESYPQAARLAELKLYSGMSLRAIGDELGVRKDKIAEELKFVRALLGRQLSGHRSDG